MPNKLAIVLHASAAEAADGVSASLDLADRTFSQLALDCTVLSTAGQLAVTIETSATGSGWRIAKKLDTLSAIGATSVIVAAGDRFLRAKWTLTGPMPLSATFSISGTAHQLYCVPSDIGTYGIPKSAIENTPVEVLAEKCLAASDEAAGYLDGAYTLPLVSWDTDLREKVACMATLKLMRFRGYTPTAGKDDTIKDANDEAIVWLNRIANGKLRPKGIIDSAPYIRETEVYVESAWPRGWGMYPWES